MQAQYQSASLGAWLERPLKVFETQWNVGAGLSTQFNPWALWGTDSNVKDKLDNFKLLKCDLMVKFMLNGSPFHYGRVMASYHPWHTFNTVDNNVGGQTVDIIRKSQRMHLYMNPTKSQGGCMCLPFFHLYNAIDLPINTFLSEMGVIDIDSINDLAHSNGSTDPITLTAYVWAVNVSLTVPTISEVFTPQMGDEYGQGIVSKPASAVAHAASKLSSVPIIGVYARATEMVATTVASVAALFGFSRPNIITDQVLVKHIVMGNAANTDAPDVSYKLSVDSKLELTIDPTTVGLGGTPDELSFEYLKYKESYLTTFAWTIAGNPEDNLFSTWVTPTLPGKSSLGGFALSPMGFVALPFEYWSGTLVFRFQVVCSAFHRGRLRLVYEPTSTTVPTTADTYITNFNRIVDINVEPDFEIAVSWSQAGAYARVLSPEAVTTLTDWYGSTLPLDLSGYCNGNLSIKILNELTAPTVSSNVQVNVFIRAGEDFEVGCPSSEHLSNMSYFEPQSGFEPLEATDSAPVGASEVASLGEISSASSKKNLVFFGETIKSFRTMMRRYSQYINIGVPVNISSDTLALTRIFQRTFPLYRGYDTSGIHSAGVVPVPYNYVQNSFLTYVTPAYVGRRGGLRYKMVLSTPRHIEIASFGATRLSENVAYSTSSVVLSDNAATVSDIAYNCSRTKLSRSTAGAFVTVPSAQPGLEIEFPYYLASRFAFARDVNSDARNTRDGTQDEAIMTDFVSAMDIAPSTYVLDQYVATGEDYTCFYFLNVPIMFFYVDPAPT